MSDFPLLLTNLFSTAFSLFLLMDSIGNIPVFLAVLKAVDPKRQRRIIFRELVIALGVIILFALGGDQILQIFQISPETVRIAGGIILFIIAIEMIFPSPDHLKTNSISKEPFLVPLAIPLTAGPAVLATVVLYSGQQIHTWVTLGAILLAWVASAVILLSSSFLSKMLGESGILACEKLMGLILTMISVEMLLQGLRVFITQCSLPG